ncbi:MAG TPA: hypothetical protein VEC56_07895, partial [Candidatus Krumholzibacteria bacterium]|nr:hypothetical protein [Candidatus Krumholzibacteria bacterium]
MNVFRYAMVGSALLATLTSCSTTVLEHEASPNASKQSFISDGLVILGCTASVDTTNALTISDEMCPALEASLSKEEKAVKVTPWKDARAALGDKARLCLLDVGKTGELSAAQIDSVAAALPKSRYVIVH